MAWELRKRPNRISLSKAQSPVPTFDPDPSTQLQQELEDSIKATLTPRRPTLTHINADTTWLLSLPYPDDAPCPPGRCRLNILIDPWFQGPQSDVAGWFSTQWHDTPSSVQTIEQLNNVLRDREDHELNGMGVDSRESSEVSNTSAVMSSNYIDAIICSHEFTDHCHQKTLEEVDPSVPCFATAKAAELVRSWNYFEQVVEIPSFGKGSDWRETSASLPSWVSIRRLVTESDALYYHSACLINFQNVKSKHPGAAEAVIYTPHGIQPAGLQHVATADPPIQTLALLHGLHDVSITLTKQLNLGAHNALKCQTILKSKYWIGTHDEVKVGGGLIAPFLRRKIYTLEDALKAQEKDKMSANVPADETNYVELASGQTLLLS
jgi:hypothetical protein